MCDLDSPTSHNWAKMKSINRTLCLSLSYLCVYLFVGLIDRFIVTIRSLDIIMKVFFLQTRKKSQGEYSKHNIDAQILFFVRETQTLGNILLVLFSQIYGLN